MEKRLWVPEYRSWPFASVRDVSGGRAGAYESKLQEARDIAMEEMKTFREEQKMQMQLLVSTWITESSSRRYVHGLRVKRDCCSVYKVETLISGGVCSHWLLVWTNRGIYGHWSPSTSFGLKPNFEVGVLTAR